MAMIKKGSITEFYANGVAIQPNYKLVEKNDGTIEGNVVFECDISAFGRLPQMKAAHPRDTRCELYNREITYMGLNKVSLNGSYFGLIAAKTQPIVSYTPNTDKNPIETHPLFEDFAGTKASPKNGAKFDPDNGEFLGFFDSAIKDLFGARNYLVPSTMVSLSYWQTSVPTISKRMTIKASIPGFRKPSDVKDFLLLDTPYRQIGSYYQVEELYLGSGTNGWSKKVY